jgi:uncharacterized coiled-coil protein SlyX
MTPDTVLEWSKALAILGAIAFGGFAIFSPSWVWFRSQLFGWGSAILCGFGTVLLVSPVFRNVHFVVDTKGINLQLSTLETQLREARASIAALTANLEQVGPVNVASVKELETRLQSIQTTLVAFEKAVPNPSMIEERIKKFETVVAELDKNVNALNQTAASAALAVQNVDMTAYPTMFGKQKFLTLGKYSRPPYKTNWEWMPSTTSGWLAWEPPKTSP